MSQEKRQQLNHTTKAAAYLRISEKRKQDTDNQLNLAKDYALKNGLDLEEDMIFYEEKPASTIANSPAIDNLSIVFKNRPKLLYILELARLRKFSHLLVQSSDRLARDTFQNALIKHYLNKYKIEIHYTKLGEVFSDDPASQSLQNIIACFAEYEASLIQVRVKNSLMIGAKNGLWPGGKLPIGYISSTSNKRL